MFKAFVEGFKSVGYDECDKPTKFGRDVYNITVKGFKISRDRSEVEVVVSDEDLDNCLI